MSKVGIRTFKGKEANSVETDVNRWIEVNSDRIEITDISTGFINGEVVVVVSYKWRF